MRSILISVTGLLLLTSAAQAAVAIVVDKNAQQMTVSVDGVPRYVWPVSSGNPSHETPNGSFRAFRMEEDHYSKEFDDAPMPHAIFFTKQGHAIHGTDAASRLGTPASHGCVRLSRANALKLWDLVKAEGVLNTTVTLTGSAQVAVARAARARTSVATRDAPAATDAYGRPLQIAPRSRPDDATGYSENLDAGARARQLSQDRLYDRGQPDDRTSYGYGYGGVEPGPMQRRVYQNGYGYRNGYGTYERDARNVRPRYYYDPRSGYYYYAD
jgi:hypothetical protein